MKRRSWFVATSLAVSIANIVLPSHSANPPRASLALPATTGVVNHCGQKLKMLSVHTRKGARVFCTHGADSATQTSTPSLSLSTSSGCVGDGVSKKRVQLIYAWQTQNRLTSLWRDIARSATAMNAYLAAAGPRRIRFVCTSGVGSVIPIHVSDDDFGRYISALDAQGYNRSDRIYAGFYDGVSTWGGGGIATLDLDDRKSLENANAIGPGYSLTHGATNWLTAMHELGHNLGAVQSSAPHSSRAGHCWDEQDLMCYDDGGAGIPAGGTIVACPSPANIWDCNNDDYWSPLPPAGSYLATHWNVFDSPFLARL
jgi:hypothetical protein